MFHGHDHPWAAHAPRLSPALFDDVDLSGRHGHDGKQSEPTSLTCKAPIVEGLDLWGPAPAPLSVIRGMHRRRFLIRANRGVDVSAFLAAWSSRVKLHSAVRVQIDVDPYSFL